MTARQEFELAIGEGRNLSRSTLEAMVDNLTGTITEAVPFDARPCPARRDA